MAPDACKDAAPIIHTIPVTLSPLTEPPAETPNPALTLQAAFSEIDKQFIKPLKSNIAYNRPETMMRDETETIELLLNPSLSQPQLATQVVERGGFVTSTAEPGQLEDMDVVTSEIEITDRMRAVLISEEPEAFIIRELAESEQVISTIDTTKWRWSVTAKEEGRKTLELVVYRLVKHDGKEFWREVETYKAEIIVKVTPLQRFMSIDWKWLLGILVTLLMVPAFWRWLDSRKKVKKHSKSKSIK